MPIPSGDSTADESGPDQLHAVALESHLQCSCYGTPCAWLLPSPATHWLGCRAVSDASPGGDTGAQRLYPDCRNSTAGAVAGTGRTAKGEGYEMQTCCKLWVGH